MSIHTRVSGSWKPVQSYVRVSGDWKAIPQVWVKKDGTWTTLYTFSWETGSWGDCSVSCGGGTQTRTVKALRSDGTYWSDTIGAMFAGDKPATSQTCNTGSCAETACDAGDMSVTWDTETMNKYDYTIPAYGAVTFESCGSYTSPRVIWDSTHIGYMSLYSQYNDSTLTSGGYTYTLSAGASYCWRDNAYSHGGAGASCSENVFDDITAYLFPVTREAV